ncbi:hypothetical protein E2C01_088388 [Portunus trituberculatus]|uniref:Uncharacterized protein n=1 Tax=Portunus trituberculatus TaxID=210409 RepID=A0A5B7JLR3_PORTR|nr:hypothetical protein [Portunus trituberculatus]
MHKPVTPAPRYRKTAFTFLHGTSLSLCSLVLLSDLGPSASSLSKHARKVIQRTSCSTAKAATLPPPPSPPKPARPA